MRRIVRRIIWISIFIGMFIAAYVLLPNIAQSQYDENCRDFTSELEELDSEIYIPKGKVNQMKILDKRWDEYIITVDQKEYKLHEPYQTDRHNDYHDKSYIPEEDMSLAEAIYNSIRVNNTIKIYESGRLIINGEVEYEPDYDYPEEMAKKAKYNVFLIGWFIVFVQLIITLIMVCEPTKLVEIAREYRQGMR